MDGRHPLFRCIPPWSIILKVLAMLHISSSFPTTFQRSDIVETDSVHAVAELEPYYYPCKAKRFLSFTDSSRWITILRHILAPYGYCLSSKETTRNGKKVIFYTIERSLKQSGELRESIILEFS